MASARSVNTYEGIPTVDADTTDYWDENGELECQDDMWE